MENNNFEQEYEYRLYRTIKEILHPSISKKNISNYKIILSEKTMPLKIFYPKKVSKIEKVIIYIPGLNQNTKLLSFINKLAPELDYLIITIDYKEYENEKLISLFEKLYSNFKYIYLELIANNISRANITLMGDSIGGNSILYFNEKMLADKISLSNQILFYPIISNRYFFTPNENIPIMTNSNKKLISNLDKYFQEHLSKKDYQNDTIFLLNKKEFTPVAKTLFLYGNIDPYIEDIKSSSILSNTSLEILPFASHDFLNNLNKELAIDIINRIKLFLNK